jgi:hypothetical protein
LTAPGAAFADVGVTGDLSWRGDPARPADPCETRHRRVLPFTDARTHDDRAVLCGLTVLCKMSQGVPPWW